MPNDLRQRGIERLEGFLSQFPEYRPLSERELKQYRIRFVAGWEVFPGLPDSQLYLRLLVSSDFPFSPPRVAVHPAPPVLTWPHLEKDGLLCVLADGAAISGENVEAVARVLLTDAYALVKACLSGAIEEDFEDEFDSYWIQWSATRKRFISLCTPDGPSRWVYSTRLGRLWIVADDGEQLRRWMDSYHSGDARHRLRKIPLIRLEKPMRPAQYPARVGNLVELVRNDQEAQQMIQDLVDDETKERKALMLSFRGRRGAGFAGIVFPAAETVEGIFRGFRKNQIAQPMVSLRYQGLPLEGGVVSRCDAAWVHGRDHNQELPVISEKTVVLLGAGSLGSGVAELLAKMGIKKLVVVDPDLMAPENASRQTLGVGSIMLYKATELCRELAKRFPHIEFQPYVGSWEFLHQRTPGTILSADLVISTIGVWKSESALNVLTKTAQGFPPVLFGWLEPHAAAGHAIAYFGNSGCLRCLTNELGATRVPVTTWPNRTLRETPMCGGMFQPYGAIELSYAQGVVADLSADILLNRTKASTHRVWIGQEKLLERDAGQWNPKWISRHGDPGRGGKTLEISASHDPDCPVCGATR